MANDTAPEPSTLSQVIAALTVARVEFVGVPRQHPWWKRRKWNRAERFARGMLAWELHDLIKSDPAWQFTDQDAAQNMADGAYMRAYMDLNLDALRSDGLDSRTPKAGV